MKGKDDEVLKRLVLLFRRQCVSDWTLDNRLTNGAAVRITGRLVSSPGAGQSHELLVENDTESSVTVLGDCNPDVNTHILYLDS